MNKPKREKKKPKQLRAAEKAHDAGIYGEGYRHGYQMGLIEGQKMNGEVRNDGDSNKLL